MNRNPIASPRPTRYNPEMRRSVQPPPPVTSDLLSPQDLQIRRLGECHVPSPMDLSSLFMEEEDGVLALVDALDYQKYRERGAPVPVFEPAGPREKLFFNPTRITCGIVTCGGLCPGQNDVIRSLVLTLSLSYGVSRILGFRYGYSGLVPETRHEPRLLTRDVVANIHEDGGTILGSSRGAPSAKDMVDGLVSRGIDVLFTIGGDGTMRGAHALCEEISRRDLPISVVAVPKTIDNDLHWVEQTFGFATAVDEARRAIMAAKVEAEGAWHGIGIVKLMGRHSGFIAAHASLANSDVNFCLVPEVPFTLDGKGGLLDVLEQRLASRHHAVIVAAEGAGQELIPRDEEARDASGNVKLADIGTFLRNRVQAHFETRGYPVTIKYIDPSYIVRSLPANSLDSTLCLMFGQNAAHAAMAGRTDMMVSYWNQRFTHVPIALATRGRKQIDSSGELWLSVLGVTGQPTSMVGT